MPGSVPQPGISIFKSRKYKFSVAYPVKWKPMVRESPAGDSVVLYSEGKNLVRALVSKNSANKTFFEKMLSDPFRASVTTDSGTAGELKIGAVHGAPGRVFAWFSAEMPDFSFHLTADLDIPFAIQNKDTLMRVLKSLSF